MNFKKIFGTAALSAALVGLAACGENPTTPTDGGEPSADTTTVTSRKNSTSGTIKFTASAGDNLKTVLEQAIATFKAANPGWDVTIETPGGYDQVKDAVTAALTAGTQPNLAYCYSDHVAGYLKTNKVINFDEYINDSTNGLSANDIAKMQAAGYYDEGKVFTKEGRYTMPMAKSTDIVYINHTVCDPIFKQLGMDPENGTNWTWDKLWAAGEALKAIYPKSTPIGYDSEANWIITYLEQLGKKDGKKLYTDSSKSGSDKLQWYGVGSDTENMFKMVFNQYKKGILTTKGVTGSYTSSLFTKYDSTTTVPADYDGSFISIGSSGGASHQMPSKDSAFTVDIAESPSIDGTDDTLKMISQGPSLVMFDSGDDGLNLATWKFIKVLLSAEVQAAYAAQSGGYSPVRSDATELLLASEDTTALNKKILNLYTKINGTNGSRNVFYTSDAFDGSAQSRVQIGNALVALLKGAAGIAAADVDDNIDSILDEYYSEAVNWVK